MRGAAPTVASVNVAEGSIVLCTLLGLIADPNAG